VGGSLKGGKVGISKVIHRGGKKLVMGRLVLFCTQLFFSGKCDSNLSIFDALTEVELHAW
jgi:hypothetical protein